MSKIFVIALSLVTFFGTFFILGNQCNIQQQESFASLIESGFSEDSNDQEYSEKSTLKNLTTKPRYQEVSDAADFIAEPVPQYDYQQIPTFLTAHILILEKHILNTLTVNQYAY